MKPLIIDERAIPLSPTLAHAVGINEAIVLQQVHFILSMKAGGRLMDGQKWIWNTLGAWQKEHFPFFPLRTLRRAITSLEKSGILLSCQPDGRMSRKKYYRIDRAALCRAAEAALKSRCGQNEHIEVSKVASSDVAKMATSITETSRDFHRDFWNRNYKERRNVLRRGSRGWWESEVADSDC